MLKPEYLPHYTVTDYRKWEGDWELIEGIPYAMVPSPSFLHQRIAGRLFVQIETALESCPDCIAVYETDWIVSDDTVVKPDILVTCEPVSEDYLTHPPRLIVEVLSPATRSKDEQLKRRLYAKQGVRFYLIVDPAERRLRVLELTGRDYQEHPPATAVLTLDLAPCAVKIDLQRLWP
ncbi:hypothetical protein MIT9_P0844 [Methylomarinovum caldicuralii]|uniref:Putative restriction endonuclease domain-containing protein n=1 Tax=Methylomarinovum caldicuralii TaxID=438856 RepID=A0AAU9BRY0_9GAMM|nr:Uma2 family endonuclease [Methylomarinovum caldicuralii]BCX81266.1 hypothetical protein MIT9_P0844 [Methylomarinovum caldicuralii]